MGGCLLSPLPVLRDRRIPRPTRIYGLGGRGHLQSFSDRLKRDPVRMPSNYRQRTTGEVAGMLHQSLTIRVSKASEI
jgi:hypothetical protein